MKLIKATGIVVGILLLLAVFLAFFLPARVRVERSITIHARPESVFDLVNNPGNWPLWSPWHKMDSQMQVTYGEKQKGTGASYSWKSNNPQVGEGNLSVVDSKPSGIDLAFHFGDMGNPTGHFRFAPEGDGVKVSWILYNDGESVSWLRYVPSKYFNLFMDEWVGKDFEAGLNNLKSVAETMPRKETIAGFDVEDRMMDRQYTLSVKGLVKNTAIGSVMGQHYAAIGGYLATSHVKQNGPPFTIWHSYGAEESEMEVAIPVDGMVKDAGHIRFGELQPTRAIVVKYLGAYSNTEPVFSAMKQYLADKSLKTTGPPREVYITDPGMEKDTAKWLTEIVFPID